jgi:hypothetical protein
MRYLLACILSASTFAGESCSKLIDCIDLASKLTGKHYIYSAGDINAEVKATPGLNWNKDNADGLLSEVLHLSGYVRLPIPAAQNTYSIINGRDIRYGGSLPRFNVTREGGDSLPTLILSDFAELHYQSKHGRRVGEIARNLRPFLSRYGRVIDTSSGILIVIDTMTNLERAIGIIRKADVPLTKQELVAMERRSKEDLREAKTHSPSPSKTAGDETPTKP